MKKTALVLIGFLAAATAFAQEPTVVAAINEPPTDEVGELHYAFEGREPTRSASFAFEGISGRTVSQFGEAEGAMVRTREAVLYSDSLPADFDCLNVWVRSKDWYVYSDPPIRPRLSVRLRDASGEMHEAQLGQCIYKDWFLVHKRLIPLPHAEPATLAAGGDGNGRIDRPAAFEAFIISGTTGGQAAALYLDHASFYDETLEPLEIEAPTRAASSPRRPTASCPPATPSMRRARPPTTRARPSSTGVRTGR